MKGLRSSRDGGRAHRRRGQCLAAPVPPSVLAFTRLPVAFVASGFGLVLLVLGQWVFARLEKSIPERL